MKEVQHTLFQLLRFDLKSATVDQFWLRSWWTQQLETIVTNSLEIYKQQEKNLILIK